MELVGFPGWVGYRSSGHFLAAAYRVKTLAKLVVWDTATFRVVRDTKIKFVNEDTDFGLQAAFHPDGGGWC